MHIKLNPAEVNLIVDLLEDFLKSRPLMIYQVIAISAVERLKLALKR